MSVLREIKDDFKRGYKLAKDIDEFINVYGREKFLKHDVAIKDKERLEDVIQEIRVMNGNVPSKESFFMACGFLKYRLETRLLQHKNIYN